MLNLLDNVSTISLLKFLDILNKVKLDIYEWRIEYSRIAT